MSFRNNQNNHPFPKDIYFKTLKSSNSLTRTSTSKILNCFPLIQDQNSLRISQNQNKKLIFSSYNSRRKISSSIDSPLFLSTLKFDTPPSIFAKHWSIFDITRKKFLFGKLPHTKKEIASLTKIMTCHLVIKLIEKWRLNIEGIFFKITKTAIMLQGTTSGLLEGDIISIADLLYALMLPSGNDAAFTIAEYFGCFIYYENIGKLYKIYENIEFDLKRDFSMVKNPEKIFVQEMNSLAKNLHLFNSYFSNPHGLSLDINISSAYDIAKLTYIALKNKLFAKIVKTKSYAGLVRESNGIYKEINWENTNKLLNLGYEGVKTGFTNNAGYCLSIYYKEFCYEKNKDINFIIVLLGCDNQEKRNDDARKIVEWTKNNLINYS